ncbi:hypothetical protein KFL_001760040 [Klebsormidium nitens]|uniref:Uncharacterized protein n=1 Tax=Klebsormidium nitens TaxID=105231 RepID=A0A1Y1HZL5_KLENI|nr:hypothetical protein KFL_001760040 [Klebsormidium nitens]|eukprot:GAQ84095.1 hypothetical protein KFL_001760040 [Klebsormidium nitens]
MGEDVSETINNVSTTEIRDGAAAAGANGLDVVVRIVTFILARLYRLNRKQNPWWHRADSIGRPESTGDGRYDNRH